MIKERLQLEGVIRDLKRQLNHAQEVTMVALTPRTPDSTLYLPDTNTV